MAKRMHSSSEDAAHALMTEEQYKKLLAQAYPSADGHICRRVMETIHAEQARKVEECTVAQAAETKILPKVSAERREKHRHIRGLVLHWGGMAACVAILCGVFILAAPALQRPSMDTLSAVQENGEQFKLADVAETEWETERLADRSGEANNSTVFKSASNGDGAEAAVEAPPANDGMPASDDVYPEAGEEYGIGFPSLCLMQSSGTTDAPAAKNGIEDAATEQRYIPEAYALAYLESPLPDAPALVEPETLAAWREEQTQKNAGDVPLLWLAIRELNIPKDTFIALNTMRWEQQQKEPDAGGLPPLSDAVIEALFADTPTGLEWQGEA